MASHREHAVLSERISPLHVLYKVLSGATLTIDLFVQGLAATGEVGNDEARIGTEIGRLDASNDLVHSAPASGSILELMKATHLVLARGASDIALGEPGRGDLLELLVNGETEDVVAA